MSGSRIYTRKPLRRYERDFSKPQEEIPAEEETDDQATEITPDITASANTSTVTPPEGRLKGQPAQGLNGNRGSKRPDSTGNREKNRRPGDGTGK